jgi:hypothetical protein
MAIIPICIFTIAYRKRLRPSVVDGKRSNGYVSCAFVYLLDGLPKAAGLLDARCFDGKLGRVHATLSNGHGGTEVLGSVCLLLNCTYFAKKARLSIMKQTQSE